MTTAGGTSAAAIATPTRIPGISEDIAIPPANPRRIATTRNTGVISVLARISGVISNSVKDDAIAVNPAPIAIITSVKINPDFAALYIFFGWPTAALKENAVIGPSKGDNNIAPITKEALFANKPTRATEDAIAIINNKFFFNSTDGSVSDLNSSVVFLSFFTFFSISSSCNLSE